MLQYQAPQIATPGEITAEKKAKRNGKIDQLQDPEFQKWKEVDLSANSVEYVYLPGDTAFISLNPGR